MPYQHLPRRTLGLQEQSAVTSTASVLAAQIVGCNLMVIAYTRMSIRLTPREGKTRTLLMFSGKLFHIEATLEHSYAPGAYVQTF